MIAALVVAVLAGAKDARERIIPNELCLALAGIGLVFQLLRLVFPGSLSVLPWESALSARLFPPAMCLASSVLLLVVLAALELAVRRRAGRAGFGFGDIKYLAAWATVLGPHIAISLAIACALGATWALAHHERDFAFGPWIGIGCAATLIALSLY